MQCGRVMMASGLAALATVASALGLDEERYRGGSYDGYAEGILLQSADALGPGGRFFGGAYDGYSEGLFLQSESLEAGHRFFGGSHDGYDDGLLMQSDPREGASRFLGGAYDGYDDALATDLPNPLLLDSDSDDLVDWWELRFVSGLAPLYGWGDYDDDGATERDELAADTVPTNAASLFEITAIERTNSFSVSFSSTNTRNYTLEGSTNPVSAHAWMSLEGLEDVPGAPGGALTLTDTNEAPFRAYRVLVERP